MVWDLPTRVFHWAFAICIIGAFISGERVALDAHEYFALTALGLLLFRVIWGFVGFHTARFSTFIPGLQRLLAYLKTIATRTAHVPIEGHNPLGGLAVLVILAVMAVMSVTGLWTGDDVMYDAPLTAAGIAPYLAAPMAAWHERLHFLVPLVVLVHLLALLAHRLWLGERLVARMVTGGQAVDRPTRRQTVCGFLLMAVCVASSLSLALLTPSYS